MRTRWVAVAITVLAVVAVLAACSALGTGKSAAAGPVVEQPAAEAQPAAQVQWQYPIAAGVWYPGDGPLPEHPFRYYKVRCWPGCHDPASEPRPHP
jgi:hypothetical protein